MLFSLNKIISPSLRNPSQSGAPGIRMIELWKALPFLPPNSALPGWKAC